MYTLLQFKDSGVEKGNPHFCGDGTHMYWVRNERHETALIYQMTRFFGSPKGCDLTDPKNPKPFRYAIADMYIFMPGGFVGPPPPGWTLSADRLTLTPPVVAAS